MERLFGLSSLNSMAADCESNSSFIWFLTHITHILNPSPPTLPRLPVELYRLILSFLPLDSKIYPLLLVNSAFHAEAKRLLYTDISLPGNLWGSKLEHMQRRMRLFKLLANAPHLSTTVNSLTIRPFVYKGELANFDTRRIYWRDLNLALRQMPNLKEFAMGRLAGEHQYPVEGLAEQSISAVFSGCTFRLRKLTIFQGDFQNVAILEKGVIGMDLEELCVPYQIGMMFEANDSLPRLTILDTLGQFNGIPKLLSPPRNVKALAWRVHRAELWRPETYPELHSLKVEMLAHNAIDFTRLALVFPSLRFLQIDFPDDLSEEMTCLSLSNFTQLRKLTFGGKATRSWKSFYLCRQIAGRLLAVNPHVELVCVGVEEWNRVQLMTGQPRACDEPDEWKEPKWWV